MSFLIFTKREASKYSLESHPAGTHTVCSKACAHAAGEVDVLANPFRGRFTFTAISRQLLMSEPAKFGSVLEDPLSLQQEA